MFYYVLMFDATIVRIYDPHEMANMMEFVARHRTNDADLSFMVKVIYEEEKNENTEEER